jgi:hypothetical protein
MQGIRSAGSLHGKPDTTREAYNLHGQRRGYGYGYGGSQEATSQSQNSSSSQGAQDKDPRDTDRLGRSILDRFNRIFSRKK